MRINKFRIPEEILRKLENKITKRITENIGNIITEKCKALLGSERIEKIGELNEERSSGMLQTINNDLLILQNDLELLKNKSDHTLGSLSYLASEYDDILTKISKLPNYQRLSKDLELIGQKQHQTEKQLDRLEQYGRRENLEIHGVTVMRNENTNQIIKSVAKAININLNDRDISTSHRLAPTNGSSKPTSGQQRSKITPPPIIVRFANRDKRNEFYRNRRLLANNNEIKSVFGASYITIRENLTTYRKMLYNTASLAKHDLNFKYLWTSQGNIRLRRDSESAVINVTELSDLNRIGYSGPVSRADIL